MAWNFSGDKPIYAQIVDAITVEVISGKYRPGYRLETVRELAVIAGVNPNTMQRALAALEDTGLIFTKRGDGRYVTEDTQRIDHARAEYVTRCCDGLVATLRGIGLSDESALSAFHISLEKE